MDIKKYQLSTYGSGSNYLTINAQGVFSFSSAGYAFCFIPTEQSNKVKISVCGMVSDAMSVYFKANIENNEVTLSPMNPSNRDSILWIIESVPNNSDSSNAYYVIKSALSTQSQAYFLNGANSNSLNLVGQLNVASEPGAFWKINELSVVKKGKWVIQFGNVQDPGSLVLNSDGQNVFLGPLEDYLISPWSWEITNAISGSSLASYVTLNNSADNVRLYLANEKGNSLVTMGVKGASAFWIILDGNLFTIFNMNWEQGQASFQFLMGNTATKAVEASAACSNPPASSSWTQYLSPTPEPPTNSIAALAVGSTESEIMDIRSLQHLALHISDASSCFVFSDKNVLKIIHEFHTTSGFRQAVVSPAAGKFLFGWALNDQNLYLLNNQHLESYDLSTIKKASKVEQSSFEQSPAPVKKSLDFGSDNQYAPPVFDNNNAFVFILRNDGNLYAVPEDFDSDTDPTEYSNSGGIPPITPLELFIESAQGSTSLYFLNQQNQMMKFEMNYSSKTIVRVSPYGTPNNLSVELLKMQYLKRTLTNPTQKEVNNWAQVDPFDSLNPTYVLDGSSAELPYMLFSYDDLILQASFVVLLIGGAGTSFPSFDFTNGTVSDAQLGQGIKVAVFTLQAASGANVKSIGCPLVNYDSENQKFEVYALTTEFSSQQKVKLRKFSLLPPTQAASLFLDNWALMAGCINNIFLSQQRKSSSVIQNSGLNYNACIQAFSTAASPVSPSKLLYQQNMVDNFYESVAPLSVHSNYSIMSHWVKFACIQNMAGLS